jgi:hypothetical protein
MLYTDFDALCLAATQVDLTDPVQVETLRHLIWVYWEAYHNPPEGIIGVGAITYAQDALIAAQLNSVEV